MFENIAPGADKHLEMNDLDVTLHVGFCVKRLLAHDALGVAAGGVDHGAQGLGQVR